VQEYETLTLGIAVQAPHILKLESELLGGTIQAFLQGLKRVA
jgi:hypothetical protein